MIIAHRGASHTFAENTEAAFDAALEEGADGIELDLQLSADGKVVVFHDDTLAKLGKPWTRVRDFRLAELQAMDVGRWFGPVPAHMNTLGEVLARYAHQTRLYLEIKFTEMRPARRRQLVAAVAECISGYPDALGIYLLSFHRPALAAMRTFAPDAACVRNLDSGFGLRGLAAELEGLAGVCVNIDRFGPRHAGRLASLNKPLYAYTVDTPAQLARARALGIAHIITNHPARSREWWARGC